MSIIKDIFNAVSEGSMRRAEEERLARLSALPSMFLELGQSMADSGGNSEEPLALLAETATMTLQASRCLLFLYDRADKQLKLSASSGAISDEHFENLRFPLEGTLADFIRRPQSASITNQTQAARFGRLSEEVDCDNFAIASFTALGHPVGLLYVDGKKGRDKFDDNDLDMLELLARFAAVAVEFSRFVVTQREHARNLAGILEVSRAFNSTHEINSLFDLILAQAVRLTGATSGELSVVDYKDNVLVVASTCGFTDDSLIGFRLALEKGIAGLVALKAKPIRLGNARDDHRYYALKKRVNSELAVPIIDQGRVIAVINLEHGRYNFFSEGNLDLLEILTANAAVAIRNAKLIEELKICGKFSSTRSDDTQTQED
jgi:GAF domain-containing protein